MSRSQGHSAKRRSSDRRELCILSSAQPLVFFLAITALQYHSLGGAFKLFLKLFAITLWIMFKQLSIAEFIYAFVQSSVLLGAWLKSLFRTYANRQTDRQTQRHTDKSSITYKILCKDNTHTSYFDKSSLYISLHVARHVTPPSESDYYFLLIYFKTLQRENLFAKNNI